ncbi:hypothetical protein KGD83_25100 [Nocardiopsis akebiae]|uniref:DUF3558 domain-containing protein n=1 Tax=Nocardiopsis akebiae TaxID=2831968 RepID=A0ABX8C253_9ACTN|nr:hypothetical protein [Nocardiopsis akebiae]QUX28472.1 hypothetical protein KGD83_25100 [Nocardiopsis akebiae]
MVDQKAPPGKQGLHGWKAAAAVFGCGTLAAFGVFGVLVTIAGLLLNTASTGVEDPEYSAGVEQTGEPREELEPGGLNICDDYLPRISDIDIAESISSEHSDDALDSDLGASDGRVVSGRCSFLVNPMYGNSTSWSFDFDYHVIVRDPSGDRDHLASDLLAQRVADAKGYFASVDSASEHPWSDISHSLYGMTSASVSRYVVVSQTRSAVYSVSFTGDKNSVEGGVVPEADFERQARDLVERLQGRLFLVIPG